MADPKFQKMMARLLENEAELGSDNEENDEIVKKINKNDEDENEDLMDSAAKNELADLINNNEEDDFEGLDREEAEE